MAKLLETRLPVATDTVTALTYNKLVRILELNLGSINIDSTPHYNDQDLSILNFNEGDIIWNTSIGVLQVYLGNEFLNLQYELVIANNKSFDKTLNKLKELKK